MPNVLHALCNAHQLRELKALIDIEKEDWARNMQQLLRPPGSAGGYLLRDTHSPSR